MLLRVSESNWTGRRFVSSVAVRALASCAMRSDVDSGEPALHSNGPPTGRQVIKDEEGTSNEQYNFEDKMLYTAA